MKSNIVPSRTNGSKSVQTGPDLGIRGLLQLSIQSTLLLSNSIKSSVWSSTSFALSL